MNNYPKEIQVLMKNISINKLVEDWINEAKLEKEEPTEVRPEPIGEIKHKTIDSLLDEYNDYIALYNTFGDEAYKKRANMVLMQLHYKQREGVA